MKKILFILALLTFCITANSQNVVREGNTFKSIAKAPKAKADTLVTPFKFEDSKGGVYPIIVNKASGRCYVWKPSGKTGKLYKQYMKEDVSKAVCEELNITYVPKK